MRKKWRFPAGTNSIILVPRAALFPEEAGTFDPARLAAQVDQWLADPQSQQTALDIYHYLHGRAPNGSNGAGDDHLQRNVSRRLKEAFKRREIVGVLIPPLYNTQSPMQAAPQPAPAPPVAPTRPRPEKKTTWIKFKVVDDETGRPIPGVNLDIRLPGGEETTRTTRSNGLIDIVGIDPGVCAVTSSLKEARLNNTLKFIATGEMSTVKAAPQQTGRPMRPVTNMSDLRIALIEEHKVRAGETLASLARDCGLSWQKLALFNWDTSDPDEINEALHCFVGCRKRTADRQNYLFDDADAPGIIYLPREWKAGGFETEATHVIRVKNLALVPGWDLIIPVEMDLDHDPDQDDELRIRAVDGSFEKTLVASDTSHVERDEETRRLFFNFGQVPELTYTVSVKIKDQWLDILHGLRVTADELTVGGRTFGADLGDLTLGTPEEDDEALELTEEAPPTTFYIDQAEELHDRE